MLAIFPPLDESTDEQRHASSCNGPVPCSSAVGSRLTHSIPQHQKDVCDMASKVRIGIIGAGAVSDYHHVPGIRIDQRCELVAICDPNQALLDQRQKDWGPTRAYINYEDLAKDPDVDAVIIATPNFLHPDIAITAARHGKRG